LGEIEVILGKNKRFLNLRAKENCELNSIPADVFKSILIKYTSEYTSTVKIVRNKYEKYIEFLKNIKQPGNKK
jgi:hypothetical protein